MKVAIIKAKDLKKYDFGPGHPFRGERFEDFFSFFEKKIALNNRFEIVTNNNLASDSDLRLWHTKQYIDAMWTLLEHRRIARKLGRLPVQVLKRYEKWKDIVRISGPAGLRLIKGFHDEALGGEWKGHRSSRLGSDYRIIYRVVSREVLVQVIDLTAHDYRRR